MPTTTIRPTKALPRYKRVDRTGGSGEADALSDQSDATYVRRKAAKAPLARYLLGTPTIPAGSDIATIVPGARLKQPTSRPPKLVTIAMSVPGTGKPKNKIAPTVTGPVVRAGSGTAAYTFNTPADVGATAGPTGPWSTLLSKLAIRVNDGHKATDANRATIYELFADVYYSARPTAAVSVAPTSPVTTTSYPELTATLTALIELWQDGSGPAARAEVAYELKVFSSAQYGAGGFDPATSPSTWHTQGLTAALDYIDGTTPSSEDVSDTPDRALPNGAYRAYARGRRNFAAAQYGAWTYLAFTVAISPPTVPTVSAVKNDAAQRVAVTVTPVTSAGATNPLVSVERSDDAGATWTPVRGATSVAGVFGTAIVFYDYEAKRATALSYRAHVEATISQQQLVSSWATAAVTGTLPGTAWNLKAPLAPELNLLGAAVNADPEYTQEEDAATFRPVGRKYPVVVSMAIGGADGSLTLRARTNAEWAIVQALRDYQGALYLESPFGWGMYIRILSRSWVEFGSASAPRRRVTVAFLEVESP